MLPSEPSRLGERSEMVQQPADSVSQSWVEALNGNKMNIQEVDSFRQLANSMRNYKHLDPRTITLEQSTVVYSKDFRKEEALKVVPILNVEELDRNVYEPQPIVSAPVTKQRSVSPGQAPTTLDLTAQYGECKSSWFTQMFEELQAKKKQVSMQEKLISELREENERLVSFSNGMPDFVERLEALINAQNFYKDSAKLHNSTPSSLMNKLEVFMCHSSMTKT